MHAHPVAGALRSAAVGLGAAALALSGAFLPQDALAAEPGQEITLMGFNDFHGALGGASALACQVETVRGQSETSFLFSAGDNVGGSAFESAVQDDEPTIDVLNALGVDATAIGNHEYDQGKADLFERIEPRTEFPDLAANVYDEATGERVHDAYTIVERDGVEVAVIGAVTTKTVGKVSPAAIEGLTFGNPVEAVNDVIGELEADGVEYDVAVALYHEGASGSGEVGSAPTNSDPIFDQIVSGTDAEVDAIFNGDSHRTYAFTAPVPGQDGEERPILQTGSSAANLGTVTLQRDEDGDWDVSADPALRSTGEDCTTSTEVTEEVTAIAQAAIDEAAVVGAEPVGSIDGDITTSWDDTKASYIDGVRTPDSPVTEQATTKGDNRARHSAAGNMLADSMRWYLEDAGLAGEHEVIGFMNPGGIRAELWDAESPAGEGDGVVTYAEANSMVPFGNTLNSGEVTGAQLTRMLEEQWQRGEDGGDVDEGDEAFLAFSVSENVEYVYDSSRGTDDRVLEVRVDGEPIDPEGTYTIVTASFLFEGGDNMWALAEAQDVRDSGVLDRDAFIAYLQAHEDLAPDYSQRQADLQLAGDEDAPTLRLAGLESQSLGAPEITSVTVDAGEHGTFEAPYGPDEETGAPLAEVALAEGLCATEEAPVPLTITTVPATGTEITAELPVTEDCGEGGEPGEAQEVSIAEIQGTGAESPLVGEAVTTEGVVTAVYATGGLNGYVIQTGGTGGALDVDTHTGSTAVFVYSPSTASQVELGDSVRVTGEVSEYHGSTQITVGAEGLEPLDEALEPVEPATLDGGFPTEEEQRESIEHMLYLPGEEEFTVTDVYATNQYGEVALAIGDEPLQQAGDIMRPGEEATAYYESREELKVLLDDGRTTNFQSTPTEPMSWLTTEEPVRVGAAPVFTEPVVVAYSFDAWRLNTTTPWESAETDGVDFENTRQDTPDEVGGDVQVSTFNVLNYFTTLGEDTPGCEPYTDIDGNGTTVRGGCDLRGAWGADDLERQQSKIVDAISGTGAEVVGLTEIENSARLGEEADEATATLVAALNEKDGEGTWDHVPTGEAYEELGLDGGQDVITNAIIYQPAQVRPEGSVQILADDPAFDNAREPLGQVFVPIEGAGEGEGDSAAQVEGEPFLFTINHFKSKGSADAEDADLEADPVQGNARTSRLQQAEALLTWGEETADELGVEDVLHGGDFNSYTQEEPLQLFYEQGFVNLGETHDPDGWSYSFGGMVGSLDHVIASPSAAERVTGATDWQINGPESVMAQYGRYNNNAVDLYEEGPFASSDHDPMIVGLDAGYEEAPTLPDFTDVRSDHPYHDEIRWAAGSGIVPGGEDGTFRPTRAADRVTLAAGLYEMAGRPEVDVPASSPFKDVKADHPHYEAMLWAESEGVLTANKGGAFRPSAALSRGMVAEALYAAAGSPEVGSPSGDAQADAIAWLQAEGLDEGIVDGDDLRPNARVDRAETAAWLYRFDRL